MTIRNFQKQERVSQNKRIIFYSYGQRLEREKLFQFTLFVFIDFWKLVIISIFLFKEKLKF